MSQATEVNRQDRYKSYIPKRRVGFYDFGDNFSTENRTEQSSIQYGTENVSPFKDKTYEGFLGYGRLSDDNNKYTSSYNASDRPGNRGFPTSAELMRHDEEKGGGYHTSRYRSYPYLSGLAGRIDTSVYNRKRPSYYGMSNRTAIEENRATLLAVKIIKQALACFAILGVIVFLQQRTTDTAGALIFIKNQVVDNHVEVSGLISGVQNIITECAKIFGGSP
ncbi:MAG: hypothetical protein GX022_04265 [Clostridiaceae bacterium]|nr:hypothetical protein [Clostridiaceae bacterium]